MTSNKQQQHQLQHCQVYTSINKRAATICHKFFFIFERLSRMKEAVSIPIGWTIDDLFCFVLFSGHINKNPIMIVAAKQSYFLDTERDLLNSLDFAFVNKNPIKPNLGKIPFYKLVFNPDNPYPEFTKKPSIPPGHPFFRIQQRNATQTTNYFCTHYLLKRFDWHFILTYILIFKQFLSFYNNSEF